MNVTEMKYAYLPSQEEVEKLVEPLAALLCSVGAREVVRGQIIAAVDRRVNADDQLTSNWLANRAARRWPAKH